MTERAKRSRVAGDFVSLATANEAYLIDWGYYPKGTAITDGQFGKYTNDEGLKYMHEITGVGATHNVSSATTMTGENGGIDYIKATTVASMYNPFITTEGYFYSCDTDGTTWTLYVKIKTSPATYLYRTDKTTDLVETTTPPAAPISS
jgi:hypothetical protein